ncbi:MAG TPA: ABC transporter ATP-binding protein [Acidimicrobiales bacterium]|jgi:iron complex transport system ATP-binding protein|nr:ABC transporter ATP-binding protein [Acidimicrobiales bacterium]
MAAREIEPALEIVEFDNLVVRYAESTALSGVSHSIERGRWLGLIGANGAGKTSLLKALARLVEFEGLIRVEGRSTSDLSRREFAQLVAYVPQKPEFPPEMRAIDYVALGRLPHLGYFGAEGPHDRDRSLELLTRLSLASMATRHLSTMSGGELQRLVLARALAQEAPVLLLDEPTSALDLGRRVEALELVDELRIERGLTVISAMHDLTLAAQFADELALLANGAIVATGSAEEVLQESSLDFHFGTRVRILRTDDGELIVVPRRTHPKGPHARPSA